VKPPVATSTWPVTQRVVRREERDDVGDVVRLADGSETNLRATTLKFVLYRSLQ
jgi:hypothetical protein